MRWAGNVARIGEMHSKCWPQNLKGRDDEDLGVDGRIMDLRDIGCEGVDWIQLAQDGDQWLVNTV
jgi:hypothetical protein